MSKQMTRTTHMFSLGALMIQLFACAADNNEATGNDADKLAVSLKEEGDVLVPGLPGPRDTHDDVPRACNAGAIASAVHVKWAKATVASAASLSLTVENTTRTEIDVRPKLHMHSPRGDFRSLELSQFAIAAGQVVSLVVPVTDLPIQSRGLPSTATVVIEWRQEEIYIGPDHDGILSSGRLLSARTETPARYITLADDGQSAAVRDLPGQEAFVRAEREAEARLSALALADEAGVIRPIVTAELGSVPFAGIGQADVGDVQ